MRQKLMYGLKYVKNAILKLIWSLKVKGFSNQSNIDELVINSMSGCNYKNYKLNNNNYKLKIA